MDKAVETLAYQRAKRSYDKYARDHSEEQAPTWDKVDQNFRDSLARGYMQEAKEDVELIAPFMGRN